MKKFSSFLVVLLLMLTSFTAHAEGYPRGDVDRDGAVNISDVTSLIDNLLAGVPEGDVDQDGAVNISDVTSLIDYLLSGSWPNDPVTPPDDGDWVDLGLPSGTIWATRNVGANTPEDYGDYFAWGETSPKSYYEWETYKWCNGSYNTLTKYCTYSGCGYNGFTDGKTELDPEDDAATVNWGSSWRMPSDEQIGELIDYCSWQWAKRNGVTGRLGTGPNGNTIFLPSAGCRWHWTLTDDGTCGDYWSRTLNTRYPKFSYYACILYFTSSNVSLSGSKYRRTGFTVRAVRVS